MNIKIDGLRTRQKVSKDELPERIEIEAIPIFLNEKQIGVLNLWPPDALDKKRVPSIYVVNGDRSGHSPVIHLAAKAISVSKLEGLESEISDYITKLLEVRELQVWVNKLNEERPILPERFRQEVIIKPEDMAMTSADERFIRHVMELAEAHISDSNFTSERFAKDMFLSRMQLHRKMKSLTGHSPGRFIRIFRLERASLLLQNHTGTIAEIACQVGYGEPSHFTSAFRNYFGIPPSAYADDMMKP